MEEFEPVTLFVRGEEDSSDEDPWDDTILVKQYDRSVNQLKSKVAKLMGVSQNAEGDAAPTKDDNNLHGQSRSKHHKKKQAHSASKWDVGSFCRAKYSADKIFYEATILSIHQEKGTCTIKYIGYDNQEEVYLDNLQPSEGRFARKAQEEQALAEQLNEANEAEDIDEMIHSDSYSAREDSKKNRRKGEQSFMGQRHSRGQRGKIPPHEPRHLPPYNFHVPDGQAFGGPSFPPFNSLPPPPPPPPHLFDHLPNDDGEALSAMLMSWYMSGYHTGYYYGLKQGRSQQNIGQNSRHHEKWRKN